MTAVQGMVIELLLIHAAYCIIIRMQKNVHFQEGDWRMQKVLVLI